MFVNVVSFVCVEGLTGFVVSSTVWHVSQIDSRQSLLLN